MSDRARDARAVALAGERTQLAWNRSSLALIACGAVVLRGLARTPVHHGRAGVGACILGLGVLTWVIGLRHERRVRLAVASGSSTSARALLEVALGVAFVGVAAFVVAALFPA